MARHAGVSRKLFCLCAVLAGVFYMVIAQPTHATISIAETVKRTSS